MEERTAKFYMPYRTLAHGWACGKRGGFSRVLAYSPVRMAGQPACPEEWLARAGKSVETSAYEECGGRGDE